MTRHLSLAEFWYLAEHVTGIKAATLIKASRVELADSALHAPQAGFGDTDFYPDLYDKAAVRVGSRGTIRCPTATSGAAWDASCCSSTSTAGHGTTRIPTLTTPLKRCSRLAREVDEAWLAVWLRKRVTFRSWVGWRSVIADRNRSRRAHFRRYVLEVPARSTYRMITIGHRPVHRLAWDPAPSGERIGSSARRCSVR